MATLLQIIQNCCDELSLPRPSDVVGSAIQSSRTLLAHAQREGKQLVKAHEWTILQRLHTFDTVASQEEYDLPDDYDRLISNTEWDREQKWPLIGPLDGVDWQVLKSGSIGSGAIGRRYRIVRADSGNTRTIKIDPIPETSGETLAFEYVSKNWCAAAGGTAQAAWAADTDVNILDDKLMELGIQARYLRGKGFDFGSIAQEYMDMFYTLKGQDRPAPNLTLTPRHQVRLLSLDNVPDTGFGS